jgi:alpha-amylase
MFEFGSRQKRQAGILLVIIWLGLLLAACGAEPGQTPVPTIAAVTTTAASSTTAVITTTNPSTAAATTASTAAAATPTAAAGGATTTIAPTITSGPTPIARAPAQGWWSNGVCYEVFVRSFFDSNGDGLGDFPGLTLKLDYIKGLGVNCIWLMPVMQSPSYHGYDTTDFYNINKVYGTNEDFKKFMREAHARGIYVLIDLVINHTSDQHPWFKESQVPGSARRDWYIWSATDPGYKTPWGATAWWPKGSNQFYYGVFDASQPDLNLRNPEVTKEIYNVTRFWLQDMEVDGFRLDAAKHLIENQQYQINTAETKAWLRDWVKYYKSLKPAAFTVGEINGNSFELQGYWPDQLDSYFEFGLAEGMVKSVEEGIPFDFMQAVDFANTSWPYQRWSTFLTNHDQNRVMSRYAGNVAQMKLAATLLMTAPGLPFIYYGEEVGAQGIKPDEELRTPMQWDSSPGAGFTTGTPWRKPNNSTATANVGAEDKDPNSLLNHYRKLIKLRRESPALSSGTWVALTGDKRGTTSYIRQAQGETVMVVANFDTKPVDGPVFSLEKSDIKAGQYTGQELLQDARIGNLDIGVGGSIKAFTPLPKLEARTAYIIKITTK